MIRLFCLGICVMALAACGVKPETPTSKNPNFPNVYPHTQGAS